MVRSYRDGVLAPHLAEAGVAAGDPRDPEPGAGRRARRGRPAGLLPRAARADDAGAAARPAPHPRRPGGRGVLLPDHRRGGAAQPQRRPARSASTGCSPPSGSTGSSATSSRDSLQDWRDADELHRLHGAESDFYLAAARALSRAQRQPPGRGGAAPDPRRHAASSTSGRPSGRGCGELVTAVGVSTVNLNTAAAPVLKALGLSDAEIVDVIADARARSVPDRARRFGGPAASRWAAASSASRPRASGGGRAAQPRRRRRAARRAAGAPLDVDDPVLAVRERRNDARPRSGSSSTTAGSPWSAITGRDRRRALRRRGRGGSGGDARRRARRRAGWPRGRIRVGLDRRLAVVKAIELPRAAGGDLAQMVGFDLERHVPFPPEDIRFDWIELPSGPEEPHRVLVAAAERRAVERPLGAAGRREAPPGRPDRGLPRADRAAAPRAPARRAVWAHRHGGATDLLFLDGRTPAHEPQVRGRDPKGSRGRSERSLPLVRWTGCDAVWISGDDADGLARDPRPAAALGASRSPRRPTRRPALPLVAALPAKDAGAALLALGGRCGPARPRPRPPARGGAALDALARAARHRRRWSRVTALLGLSLALTHAIKTERYLARLTQEIRRLDPEAKAVEGLAAELARKKRLLAALRSARGRPHPGAAGPARADGDAARERLAAGAHHGSPGRRAHGPGRRGERPHPAARSLAAGSSGWSSPSPVTKTQNKEQFRLRAGWEPRPARGPGLACRPSARRERMRGRRWARAVALVVGGYLFLVEPLIDSRPDRARPPCPRVRPTLERRRLLVGQQPRLVRGAGRRSTQRLEAESGRLLRGPTAPLAASELQKIVKDLLVGEQRRGAERAGAAGRRIGTGSRRCRSS